MNQKIEVLPPSYQSLYIEMLFNDLIIANGTAFIVEVKNNYFLITNWHNVSGRSPETKKTLCKEAAIPNKIRIYFNEKNRLGYWITGEMDLYRDFNDESSYIWLQHPTFKERVDVVAIKIDQNARIDFHAYQLHLNLETRIFPSDPLSVVGFPFGKRSQGYLAIWATGTLASDIDVNYEGLPCFLIDCRSRKGQSGSPIIAHRDPGHFSFKLTGETQINTGFRTELYGIYSGRINKESDLGFVWKTKAIQEIVEQKLSCE